MKAHRGLPVTQEGRAFVLRPSLLPRYGRTANNRGLTVHLCKKAARADSLFTALQTV